MRLFCIATIGTILGILIGLYFSSIVLFLLLIFLSIILFLIFKNYRKQILIFSVCLFLFAIYTNCLEIQNNNRNINYQGQEVEIQAIVISDKTEKEYKDSYKIKVINIQNKIDKDFYLLLNVKIGKEEKLILEYGDKVTFKANYEVPSISRNEGGFDYQKYLKTKRITGTVTVKKDEITMIGKNKTSFISTWIHNIKEILINKIEEILPSETANLCIGLLVGEKSGITEEVQENFRKSNLSHMLAISGAHVSYLLIGISFFMTHLKLHKRWANLFIILFLLFFMALVGFTPSVTRACVMSILILVADLLFKKSDIYQNLAISSFIILLANPYNLLDIGFQLSFGGTIGIVLFNSKMIQKIEDKRIIKNIVKYERLEQDKKLVLEISNQTKLKSKLINYLKQMIAVSLSANIVIIPIMMYHFNMISFTFLISNLLASPILGIALILGLIFIFFILIFKPIARFVSFFLQPNLQLLIQIANISSKLPFSQILVQTPSFLQIMIYYIFLIILFYSKELINKFKMNQVNLNNTTNKIKKYKEKPKNSKNTIQRYISKNIKKVLIIFLLISLMFPYLIPFFPTHQLTIHFIDVGQGDSILIQTSSNKKILIDGGGSEIGSFDIGEKTLLPYLLNKGILKLNYLLFSHFDTDHCGGLLTALEKLKVENVIISKQGKESENFQRFMELAKEKEVNIIIVTGGDKITLDRETYLDILFPMEELISENILNNNSIVAKLCWNEIINKQEFSILLTGDIEAIAEKKLVEQYKNTNKLKANILKVAHHGSKTSSTQEFLNLVYPQIALIGVGEKNTFGHPSKMTIERLDKLRLPNL